MAITDINISEELITNAPSIKYKGEEGPRSPEEMKMMRADAMLKEAYDQYVYDLLEQRPEATPMSFEEFRQMVIAEGQMSGGQPLPEDPTKPINPFGPKPIGPVLPDKRQMAAFGGIMGLDGRRQYGIGSKLKKFVRKVIPNEVSEIAVKAAPFVAPFNPAVAAAMAGIGGFDQTGRIGSSLKGAAKTYALGQLGRQLGGAELQGNPFVEGGAFRGGLEGFKAGFSSPYVQGEDIFSKTKERFFPGGEEITKSTEVLGDGKFSKAAKGTLSDPLEKMDFIDKTKPSNLKKLSTALDKAGLDTKAMLGILGISAGAGLYTAATQKNETLAGLDRGKSMDIESIRAEVIEAFKDPTGEKLKAIRTKYPFLGTQASKNIANMAYGGRINRAEGGLMNLGGLEKDYRAEGGFVPIGKEEKADDVPARLSVNEFVFTADAVRNAGGGDIDRGAEVMENMMKHLEAGGQVSEESQGLSGARDMFAVSERLSEVV